MSNVSSQEKILFLFDQKLSLLKQYLAITGDLYEKMTGYRHENFMTLVSDRQQCIQQLQIVDQSINRFIKTGVEKLGMYSGKFKGLIDNYLNEFKMIVEMALPIDSEILARARHENETDKQALLKRQKDKHAARSYGAKMSSQPRYLDTKR